KTTHHTAALTRVIPVRAPAPIIRVSAPRAAPTHHKKHHGKKRHHHSGSLTQQGLIAIGIGGAVVGFLEKSIGDKLPTIPLLGRKGTLAVGLAFFGKGKGGVIRDAAIAAAAIAGYELGKTGSISGDIVPQVSGIAAQV